MRKIDISKIFMSKITNDILSTGRVFGNYHIKICLEKTAAYSH